MKNTSLVAIMLMLLLPLSLQAKVIRVLAIGNSFSEDAVEQNLYELALAQGDTLIIGNAYIGGCTLERHLNNARTDKAEYAYRKIVNGKKTSKPNAMLKNIIADEPWDIISLQQQSGNSGIPSSYSYLRQLKRYVENSCTNKNVEIIWHATWAYANNYMADSFAPYGYSQFNMLYAICQTLDEQLPKSKIKRYIPNHLTIQHAREKLGDKLNRDGYHLSLTIGRYAAACTWCEFLTGKNIVGNPFFPKTISNQEALILQIAAHQALSEVATKR